MQLVFDTNVLIQIERNHAETLQKLEMLSQKYAGQPTTTFLNVFEFLVGFRKIHKELDAQFLENFFVLNTTVRTAYLLAELKDRYDRYGATLPLIDMMIAALVIEHDAILLTGDRDFARIKELRTIFLDEV